MTNKLLLLNALLYFQSQAFFTPDDMQLANVNIPR